MRQNKLAAALGALILALVTGTAALGESGVAGDALRLDGVVEFSDLEGGFYQVGGYGLIGDTALFKRLVGQRVVVSGQEFTGMSIRMVKQVEVGTIVQMTGPARALPEQVTVGGKRATFDQGPVVLDGTLMVPLRAVVETAGGTVQWEPRERAVLVTISDRTAQFVIGQTEAEMNQNGYRYFRRNMIAMSKAPVIRGDRTLISADALSAILGLGERPDEDASLDLQPLN